jgi:hypothetical protein
MWKQKTNKMREPQKMDCVSAFFRLKKRLFAFFRFEKTLVKSAFFRLKKRLFEETTKTNTGCLRFFV